MNKYSKKKITLKKELCSPKNNEDSRSFTCYTDEQLNKLKDLWNARYQDNQIKSNSSIEIWKFLKNNLSDKCDVESCWLRRKFVENDLENVLLNRVFAPYAPESWNHNINEWLSSVDITKVMKQWETKYKCFSFIGPSPIDFDEQMLYGECVWDELCNFNLVDYIKKDKTKLGFIFNTDPHYKHGRHWISMFINIKKKYIYFFDSNGNTIPKQIKYLVKRIMKQGENINIHFNFFENAPFVHQKKDSECGMYSLYFIIELLRDNKTPEYFSSNRVSDNEMEQKRNQYFNIIPLENNDNK